ncbi:MAG TPA: hypothetical protein VJB87_04665 [Candidatus Nanoarchaeia archaeon]|nr:hypothetical protein [Candidatus Nanoarchaeia archaeon]
MSLESRVAYWVDLGVRPYADVLALQQQLVGLRQADSIPDVILSVQHPLEVSFGNDNAHNIFSDKLLREAGSREAVIDYLARQGIGFSHTSRSGGATVLSPGQYVFYPIVDADRITGRSLGVSEYKSRIYRIMFRSLQALGVQNIHMGSQQSFETRGERKDVWVQRDGKVLKMGSKGISLSGKVAYHGFSLYVDASCVKPFWLVHPCGYSAQEVAVTSVEHEVGRPVDARDVVAHVKNAVMNIFSYEKVMEKSIDDITPGVMVNAVA